MGNKGTTPKKGRSPGSKKLREEDDEGAATVAPTETESPETQGVSSEDSNFNSEGESAKSIKKKKKKRFRFLRRFRKSKKGKNKEKNTSEEITQEKGDKEERQKKTKSANEPKVKEGKRKKEKKDKKNKKEKSPEKKPAEDTNTQSPEAITQDIAEGKSTISDDTMRGKENTRPVSTYTPRAASPKGPGVSALMEKFGGGTPSNRPVSYAATGASNPKKVNVHGRSTAYSRMDESPGTGPESNVSALKEKFRGNDSGSQVTPVAAGKKTSTTKSSPAKTVATPSKFKGVTNTWQPKQYSPLPDNGSKSDSDVEQTSLTPTATTTTTTTTVSSISALRNKFNNNAEDKPAGPTNLKPDKKRKISETDKRADQTVKKENEKNRSPRKFWSPKKQASATTTPSRDSSPTIDASSRKRKGNHLSKLGGKGKAKTEEKQEPKASPVISRTNHEQNSGTESDEERRERARQLILNRTSALIGGVSSLPKTTASTTAATTVTSTPSRVHFDDTVPKRTKRDDSPKVRPKTEYDMQRTPSPRPRSIADTRQMFSSPVSPLTTSPGGTNIISNPKTNKDKLLQWCQINTQGYEGVHVTNFSSSWADGLAFCALVHKFHPTAFNYNSLSGSNRAYNFNLAFSSAEKCAKVTPLLETQDMLDMGDKPDWKCVFTYMTSLYKGLNGQTK